MKRSRLIDLSRTAKKARKESVLVVAKRAPLRRYSPFSKPELKEFTVIGTLQMGIAGGATGNILAALNNIATGTDITNRIGRHITPKTIQTDITIIPPTTVAGVAQEGGVYDGGFIALVYDNSPDGSSALFANVFDTASSLNPGSAFKNTLQYRDRFHICWLEQVGVVGNYSAATLGESGWSQGPRKIRKFYKCQPWMKVEYNSSGAGVPNTGAFYIIGASTNASNGGANDMFGFGYTNKLTFTDT